MKIVSLSLVDSRSLLSSWDTKTMPQLEYSEYINIRESLQMLYNNVKNSLPANYDKYRLDVEFGVKLKSYFDTQSWFNLRVASDIGFWRYLSVVVVPNIVLERYPIESVDHYYDNPNRIWLHSIWRYAFLAWYSDEITTKTLLLKSQFSTDTIMNIVERSGRKGTLISLYRELIKRYALMTPVQIASFKKPKTSRDSLFRSLMRLNTARIMVLEPSLCKDGISGYIDSLFADLGIIVEKPMSKDTNYEITEISDLHLADGEFVLGDKDNFKDIVCSIKYDKSKSVVVPFENSWYSTLCLLSYDGRVGIFVFVGSYYKSVSKTNPFPYTKVYVNCSNTRKSLGYVACERDNRWGILRIESTYSDWIVKMTKSSFLEAERELRKKDFEYKSKMSWIGLDPNARDGKGQTHTFNWK